ncbi:MAG: TetR/AcrR family transcriptional regulator [Melioribacteraceae bacterium]|nr:TetR/AcrR family transcriptional regulator [Melioribacteraceae bacterium]MCF8414030.1 TetR/AcrR family transcriptional regulator [Melioribacteraceae bacterium]
MFFEIRKSDSMSRRDRERLFKRNEILNASLRIFAEKGFKQTTLDEIAEVSEYGKGTIYNYFSNKEEIYTAIMEEVSFIFSSRIKEIYSENLSVFDFLTNLTKMFFEFYETNQPVFLLMVRIRTDFIESDALNKSELFRCNHTETLGLYREVLQNGIDSGEIKPIDIDNFITFYRGALFHFISHSKHNGNKNSIEENTNFIINIVFNGIFNQ